MNLSVLTKGRMKKKTKTNEGKDGETNASDLNRTGRQDLWIEMLTFYADFKDKQQRNLLRRKSMSLKMVAIHQSGE